MQKSTRKHCGANRKKVVDRDLDLDLLEGSARARVHEVLRDQGLMDLLLEVALVNLQLSHRLSLNNGLSWHLMKIEHDVFKIR